MKLPPVGAGLFHGDGGTDKTDGQTNITKPTVAFRNFAKLPKRRLFKTFGLLPGHRWTNTYLPMRHYLYKF